MTDVIIAVFVVIFFYNGNCGIFNSITNYGTMWYYVVLCGIMWYYVVLCGIMWYYVA